MAEILSAETLKATKVGKIEEAKKIIQRLMDAEKDQTKTAKPNAAKLKKWQNAQDAYTEAGKVAKTLFDKIKSRDESNKESGKPSLLQGKELQNMTINEMQSILAKLNAQDRDAILNGSGIENIKDVQLSNDWYEKGGGLSNLGNDIVKGGDKSVAISKAFTGVAIASFAVSGINSIFGAGTVGSLLATHIPQAVTLAGTALKALWGFSPLGTAMLGAMVALKVIPTIARFVNKMKNKYAALTRANTMKNKLAELAEKEGQSVEFENEFTARDSGKGEQVHTTGGNGGKDTGNPKPEKPQSLYQRMKGKDNKEQTAMLNNASLEEQIGFARESLEECEKVILGFEESVNEIVAQYQKATDPKIKKGLENTLSDWSKTLDFRVNELDNTFNIINKLFTNYNDNAEIKKLHDDALSKVGPLKSKATAIQTACKKKQPVQSEGERKLKETPQTAGGGRKPGKGTGVEFENEEPGPLDFLPPVSQAKAEAAKEAYNKAFEELQKLLDSADGNVLPKKVIVEHDGIEDDMGYGSGLNKDGTLKTAKEIEEAIESVKKAKEELDKQIQTLRSDMAKAEEQMAEALKSGKLPGNELLVQDYSELCKKQSESANLVLNSKIDKIEKAYNDYLSEAQQNLNNAKSTDQLSDAVTRFTEVADSLEKALSQKPAVPPETIAEYKNKLDIAYNIIKQYATETVKIGFRRTGTIENLDPEQVAEIDNKYNKLSEESGKIINAHLSATNFENHKTMLESHIDAFDAAIKAKEKGRAIAFLKSMDKELEALQEIVKTDAKFNAAYTELETKVKSRHSTFENETFEKPKTSEKFAGMSREQKIAEALKRFENLNLSAKRYEKGNDEGGFGYVTDSKKLPEGQSYAFTVIDEMGLDEADKEVIYELLHTALESRKGQQAQDVKRGKDAIKNNKNLEDAYNRARELIEE